MYNKNNINVNINSLKTAITCFQRALEYATFSHISKPNPHVGAALLHNPSQTIIGLGCTQNYGKAHAERSLLEKFLSEKNPEFLANECTLYVSLEPCAHHGKTPPCVDIIIAAGVLDVCVLIKDPNPNVNGRGMQILRENGIHAYYLEDLLKDLLKNLNSENKIHQTYKIYKAQAENLIETAKYQMRGFLKFQATQKPWIRLKAAISLDGFMALNNGTSKWLTSNHARQHNQALRARADVVLSTFKTVSVDNARLNVRQSELLNHFEFMQNNLNFLMSIDEFKTLSASNAIIAPERWIIDNHQQLSNPEFYAKNQDLAIYKNIKNININNNVDDIENIDGAAFSISSNNFNKLNKLEINKENLNKNNINPKKENIKKNHIKIEDIIDLAIAENKQEIHIEAGSQFSQYILETDIYDELVIYQAPIFLGAGLPFFKHHVKYQNLETLEPIEHTRLHLMQQLKLGDDVCLIYTKK